MEIVNKIIEELGVGIVGRRSVGSLPPRWFERLGEIAAEHGEHFAFQVEMNARGMPDTLRALHALEEAYSEVLERMPRRCRDCGGGLAELSIGRRAEVLRCLVCGNAAHYLDPQHEDSDRRRRT